MSKFPELTEAQREPLFKLVRYQREEQEELRFNRQPLDPFEIAPHRPEAPVVANAHLALVNLWVRQGYVQSDTRELILCKLALDYEDRMSKNPVQRWLLGVLDDWRTDLRSLVVAIVGTILTALALHFAGL